MLPRRSTVLRCFVLGAASVIVLVWVICADHRETSDGVAVSTAVKSQLSREFSKLQFEYGGDKPNFHYSDTTRLVGNFRVTSPRTCWRRRQLVSDTLATCYGLVTDKSLAC